MQRSGCAGMKGAMKGVVLFFFLITFCEPKNERSFFLSVQCSQTQNCLDGASSAGNMMFSHHVLVTGLTVTWCHFLIETQSIILINTPTIAHILCAFVCCTKSSFGNYR